MGAKWDATAPGVSKPVILARYRVLITVVSFTAANRGDFVTLARVAVSPVCAKLS